MHSSSAPIDCLIVGYNDVDFDKVVASARRTARFSGAYGAIRLNSVPLAGQRVTYMTLLERAIERARGRAPGLHMGKLPSLGAWYLRNYVATHGYHAEVVNSFNADTARLEAALTQGVRVVAITTTFYTSPEPIQEIARFVRARAPDALIVVGGPYVFNSVDALSVDPEALHYFFRSLDADILIVDSQGELTLTRVIAHARGDAHARDVHARDATAAPAAAGQGGSGLAVLAKGERVSTTRRDTIANLVFEQEGRLVITPREIENNDMDAFSVDWSKVERAAFTPTAVTRTARSCAFSCSFCRYPVLAGPLNLKSLDTIRAQLDTLAAAGVSNLVIIDDTFNVPLPRFKKLCRMLIERDYGFQWFSYFRAANADDQALDLMAEAGCGGVFLGIESGDQTILDNMNKSAKIERYLRNIKELNKRDIITFASIIVGFPGETEDTVNNTIQFLNEAAPTYWRAELYFHGTSTPIQERAREFRLQGAGYSWRHATMDWKNAIAQTERMFHEVRSSVLLPLYMFDFWAIPYLLGEGLSKQEIHGFAAAAQDILLAELRGENVDASARLDELSAVFGVSN